MQRLFKMTITTGIQSLLPILLWVIIGVIRDSIDISNGFTLTYPYQFIYLLVMGLLMTGSLKLYKLNDVDKRLALGMSIISFLTLISIGGILILLMPITVKVMGTSIQNSYIIAFGILNISIDVIPCSISKYLLYEGEDTESLKLTIKYYLGRLPIAIILAIVIKNEHIMLISISFSFFILAMVLCRNKLKMARFSIKMFKGAKYQLCDLGYTIGMIIIYTFGINKVAQSAVMLAAYNAYALCTDTQWDVLSYVIDTDVTLDISDGKFNMKGSSKKYIIYSITLFISSVIMVLALKIFINFDLKICFIILIMECGLFPIYAIKYEVTSILIIYASEFWMTLTPIIVYSIRTVVTIVIKSNYALSYGVISSCVTGMALNIIMYVVYNKKIKAGLEEIKQQKCLVNGG